MKKRAIKHMISDKAAGHLARMLSKLQKKFADVLSGVTRRLSSKKLKVMLILFCISWGGLSVYFLFMAIARPASGRINIDAIKPVHMMDRRNEVVATEPLIDDTIYQRLLQFKQSPVYDSTIRHRPGLLDSMNVLEQIYQSQQK